MFGKTNRGVIRTVSPQVLQIDLGLTGDLGRSSAKAVRLRGIRGIIVWTEHQDDVRNPRHASVGIGALSKS